MARMGYGSQFGTGPNGRRRWSVWLGERSGDRPRIGLRVAKPARILSRDSQSLRLFSRSALLMTATELKAIAAPASIGLSIAPVSG